MAAVGYTPTKEEQDSLDFWYDAKGAKVIKDFTYMDMGNKFIEVKQGTLSTYQSCNFDFGIVSINIMTVSANPDYFEKI